MYLISFVLLCTFTVPRQSQRICNITSTNLPTVTAAGGVIANGTQNVILYCICREDNVAVGPTRWLFNDGAVTFTQANGNNPYYRNSVPGPLFIPLFIMGYEGTYRCESDRSTSDNSITLTITLPGTYMYI